MLIIVLTLTYQFGTSALHHSRSLLTAAKLVFSGTITILFSVGSTITIARLQTNQQVNQSLIINNCNLSYVRHSGLVWT